MAVELLAKAIAIFQEGAGKKEERNALAFPGVDVGPRKPVASRNHAQMVTEQ